MSSPDETENPSAEETPAGEDGAPSDGSGDSAAAEAETPVITDENVPAVDPGQEIAHLRDLLEDAERRANDAIAKLRAVSKAYSDLQSEMSEFRQRMEQHAKSTAARKGVEAVRAFFEPVENLRRSLDAKTDDARSLQDGLRMVLGQFDDAMKRLGLTEVPGVGATFDPNLHEALAVMPVADKAQDGKVLVVHRNGYAAAGHVIQPAQVVIGKYEAPAEA